MSKGGGSRPPPGFIVPNSHLPPNRQVLKLLDMQLTARKRCGSPWLLASLTLLDPGALSAAGTNQQPYRLDAVVVTETAGDAPPRSTSVTVLSGATLTERGVTSTRELTALTPNLKAFDANGDRTPRFSLRGLRENNFSYGESAVGIYVDDVPYSDLYTRGIPLFDIDSGEFYRGPQPTLFGANRPGGVLNLLTRLPGNNWTGHGSVSYGNYNAIGVEAGVGGPMVKDQLFLGVSGLYNQRDGYFDNLVTGRDPDHHETLAGRAQLRWTPTETLDFTASVIVDRFHDGGVIVKPITAPGDFYDVKYDQDGFNHQDSHTYALRGAWTGESVKAVSITTWRDWRQSVAGDFDFAEFFSPNNFPLNGLQGFAKPKVQQWSQEIRLESPDPRKGRSDGTRARIGRSSPPITLPATITARWRPSSSVRRRRPPDKTSPADAIAAGSSRSSVS